MTRTLVGFSALIAGLILSASSVFSTAESEDDGWISLFNGKDFTGWKMSDSKQAKWRVEDGMIVANGPSVPIEEIAASADGPRWSPIYGTSNLEGNRQRIDRFQAAGAQGVVVTIDQQASVGERDLHDRHLGGNPSAFGGGAITEPPTEGAAR